MYKNGFIILVILIAIFLYTVPASSGNTYFPFVSRKTNEFNSKVFLCYNFGNNSNVKVEGGDYIAAYKNINHSPTKAELENIVKKVDLEFRSLLTQKYNDHYTIFGIEQNGFVVPNGSVPEGVEILWQTGAVKYSDYETSFVLPDILIHAAKESLRLTQTVIRGLSKSAINQQYNLVDLPNFDIELHILSVDKHLIVVGLGFILKGIQAGPRIHNSSFSGSGLLINGSSLYLGSTIDYDYLLKDYPDVSPGRKSVIREIVEDVVGIDFVINAKNDELIDSFSKVSKDVREMSYIKSHCLNRASLDALKNPVRIIDDNYQLTQIGVSILKSVAKDLKVSK